MNARVVIPWSVFATVSAASAVPGWFIPIERQLPLYEGLRDGSAIIFGVVGAWIALVYPSALANLRARRPSLDDPETVIASKLFNALLCSAGVLATALVLPVGREVLRVFPELWTMHGYLRAGSFILIVALTCLLLWALLLALLPGEAARRDLSHLERRREFIESRRAAR